MTYTNTRKTRSMQIGSQNAAGRWIRMPSNASSSIGLMLYVIFVVYSIIVNVPLQDESPAHVQWLEDCPYFPNYCLANDPTLVDELANGRPINKMDIFEERFMRWIPTTLSHMIQLQSDCHVFLCRHGVTICKGFDALFELAREASHHNHICFNMKGECGAVRAKLKKKQCSLPPDSDSEVEIVAQSSLAATKRPHQHSPSQDHDLPQS